MRRLGFLGTSARTNVPIGVQPTEHLLTHRVGFLVHVHSTAKVAIRLLPCTIRRDIAEKPHSEPTKREIRCTNKAPHRRSGEGQSSISVTVSALLFMGLFDSQEYRLSVQASLAEHIDRALPAVRPFRIPQHGHAGAAVRALNVYDHSSSAPNRPSCAVCVLRSVSIAPDLPSAYQPVPSLTQVLASIQPSWSK